MKYDFYNSSAYSLSNFILKKCNFEDNSSAKIEQSGFMNENKHGSHEQPPANSSPKYGQTGNVKLLTANHSLLFAVK